MLGAARATNKRRKAAFDTAARRLDLNEVSTHIGKQLAAVGRLALA